MTIFSVDSAIQQMRREPANGEEKLVILGTGQGRGIGDLYARLPTGPNQPPSQYLWARDLGSKTPFEIIGGAPVSIGHDVHVWVEWLTSEKMWRLKRADLSYLTAINRSAHFDNPNDAHNQYHRTDQLLPLLSFPVGGMKVAVAGVRFTDLQGRAVDWKGTSNEAGGDAHIDLTSFIPATTGHRGYAEAYFDVEEYHANNHPIAVVVSTSQTGALNNTDIQECIDQLNALGTEYLESKAYRLDNGMTQVRGHGDDQDRRPWLTGRGQISGASFADQDANKIFAGPPSGADAPPTFRLMVPADIPDGMITVPKYSAFAVRVTTTAPTVNDDSADGYAVGSRWIDTATDKEYVLADSTVGAAVWVETTAGGGGMTSFNIDADTGTVEAVVNGDTVLFQGGFGIATAVTAPDTIYIELGFGTDIGTVIGYNAVSNPYETANAVDISAIWGETVAAKQLLYLKSDDKFWKGDSDPALISSVRGVVVDASGTLTANNAGIVRAYGIVDGFAAALTNGDPIYLSSTAGGYTQTPPSPALGGLQIASVRYGHAASTSKMFVDTRFPVRYMKRVSLADGASTTITHYADVSPSERKVYAMISSNDVAIIEMSGGAQDSSRQLKGQSGAGSTNAVDAAGATTTALGDTGGTDFRLAQSFQVTAAGQLSSIVFRSGATTGTPSTTTVPYRVETDAAGIPSGVVLASGSTPTWVASGDNTITITDGPFLSTGTTCWFVLELATMQSTGNFYTVLRNTAGGYGSGLMKWDSTTGASFPNTWAGGAGTNDMRVSITVSAVVANDGLAQGFSHSATTTVPYADILLKKTGAPTGDLTLAIYSNSGGFPNTVITNGTATTRLASDLTTGYTLIRFTWASPPTITASTQYHLVLTTSDSASNTAYVEWGIDISSPPYANGVFELLNPTWSNASPAADGIFDLYGVTTSFGEAAVIGRWSGGTRDIAVRYDDGSGSTPTTSTTFKNTSGITLDITCIVEFP